MKHLKSFNEINEEINLKKLALGGMIGATLGSGLYYNYLNYGKAKFDQVEVIGNGEFKKYDLILDEVFQLCISKDFVISAHWTEQEDHGKKTKTLHYYNITARENIKQIYYKKDFLGNLYASGEYFNGAKKVNISDLSIVDETMTYVIYSGGALSPFDNIIVNKGHTKGKEFTLSDNQIASKYICDYIGTDAYLFGFGKGAKFSGGGAGSEF